MTDGRLCGVSGRTGTIGSMFSDEWYDQAAVRVARTLSRWPNCSAADFLGELARVLDKIEELADLGIDFADLARYALDVRLTESDAKRDHPRSELLVSREARDAVVWANDNNLPPDMAARIFGLPEEEVDQYLEWKRVSKMPATVLALHQKGLPVHAISKEVEISRVRVYEVLERHGLEPNVTRVPTAPAVVAQIKADKAAGYSLSQIAKRQGVSVDRVKNALYPRKRKS